LVNGPCIAAVVLVGEVDWNATTKTHETPVNKVWVAVEKRAVVICGGVTQLRPAGIKQHQAAMPKYG